MGIKIGNQREGGLMVWLLFMGGLEARDELDRMWFVDQISKLARRLGLEWVGVRSALEELWLVEAIHGVRCRRLWEEVVFCREVEEGLVGLI